MNYKIQLLTKVINNDNHKIILDNKYVEEQSFNDWNDADVWIDGFIKQQAKSGVVLTDEDFKITYLDNDVSSELSELLKIG